MDGSNVEFYKWLKAQFIYSCHKRYHKYFDELFDNMHENTLNGFYDQFLRWENNALGIHGTPAYTSVKSIMSTL